MEAIEILAQLEPGAETPPGWIVFPLLRSKVIWGIVGWVFGIIMGLGLFIAVAPVVIPANYLNGTFSVILTTLILGALLFIGLGSAWSLYVDIRRLQNAKVHVIVITPEVFVKQEGKKVVQVPLMYVKYVTVRGVRSTDEDEAGEQGTGARRQCSTISQMPSSGENMTGFFLGRGLVPSGAKMRRRRVRTPMSLAFIDARTDREVLVVSDGAYGDPFRIAVLLKKYAAAASL